MSTKEKPSDCPLCKSVVNNCFNCKEGKCARQFSDCKVCYVETCVDNSGNEVGGGSNQFVIIGVVAGCLGIVAVVMFVWLVIRARRRKQYQDQYQSQVKLNPHQRNQSVGSLVGDSAFGIQSIFNNNDPANSTDGIYSDAETFNNTKSYQNTQISTQRTSLFGSLGNGKNADFSKSTLSFSSVTADNTKMSLNSQHQLGNNFLSQIDASKLTNSESAKHGTGLSQNTRMENFHMTRNFDNVFDTKILPTTPGQDKF